MKHKSITIGRQYGSGGRAIGKMLSQRLDLPFYDRELLIIAAEETGLDLGMLEDYDEKRSDGLLYNFAMFSSSFTDPDAATRPYEIFQTECEVISWLARRQSCIFIGRCADFVLKGVCDTVDAFIYASSMEERIARVRQVDRVEPKKAEKYIKRMDLQRESYYNFFTGGNWGDMETYDLCLNTSALGYETCADLIATLYEK